MEARNILDRLYRAVGDASSDTDAFDTSFVAALCDDLNTPAAMARLHELAGEANKGDEDAAIALKTNAGLLRLLGQTRDDWASGTDDGVDDAVIDAQDCGPQPGRADRDFATADAIRDELAADGFFLRMDPMVRSGGEPSQTASILLTSPFSGRVDGPFGRTWRMNGGKDLVV